MSMEDTTTLKGFDLIIDNGTCMFDIFPISHFSATNDLNEAIKKIEEKTNMMLDSFVINKNTLSVTVYLQKIVTIKITN
jgi:hypothetical protein